MSWDHPSYPPSPARRMRAPADGIVASHRPKGWLAKAWLEIFKDLSAQQTARVARGRAFARGGRVRGLWFSPGLANAEVIGSEVFHVSLRVKTFKDSQWAQVVALLSENLGCVSSLLEGKLPRDFVEELDRRGLNLLPTFDDFDGDCNCGDFMLPCAHTAAVHTVLADALEGEPFLVLTLRGRPREQVLAALRRHWGDTQPIRSRGGATQEDPPDVDGWFTSPADVPAMSFSFQKPERNAIGLRALGPAPADEDLNHTLGPLYDSGSDAAIELALREHDPEEIRARRPRKKRPLEELTLGQAATDIPGLTELLVDALAEMHSARSKELAEKLGVDPLKVRAELLTLERLGVVYRTGQTRGTRWWLG